jgi:hypothetical protein
MIILSLQNIDTTSAIILWFLMKGYFVVIVFNEQQSFYHYKIVMLHVQ